MICVTGGTGLVGSHLLFELTSKGEKVRAIRRVSSDISIVKHVFSYYTNNAESLFNQIEWVEGDVLDRISLHEAFDGIEKVYHAAAVVSFDPSQKRNMFENNITGTANVVNACLNSGVKKLCYVSSVAAIGSSPNGLEANEEMIWSPSKKRSYYSVSKFHAEMEVWRGIQEGLNAVIVNPSVILGPGNWGKSSTALFPTIYKGMKFYTPGITGYVDVRDVVKAMLLLMDSDISAQRYILNAGELSYKEAFSQIAIALQKPVPTVQVKKWMAEIAWRIEWLRCKIMRKSPQITRETASSGFNKSAFSSEKISKEFNFEFIPIMKSIADTSALYLKDI